MAVLHGKAATINIGANEGAQAIGWTINGGASGFWEITPFNATVQTFLPSPEGWTGTLTFDWSKADSNVQGALLTAALNQTTAALRLYIDGSNYLSLTAYISLNASSDVNDAVKRSFTFQSNGALSYN